MAEDSLAEGAGESGGDRRQAAAAALELARRALEQGDYGQVVRLLEPLCEGLAPQTPLGGELRLVLATARMGQGDGEAALGLCRSLRVCSDGGLRSQARDLEEILAAPALRRPREWSLTLPPLGAAESLAGRRGPGRRSSAAPPPPPPPVGPTRAPLGFAALTLVVLLLLFTLLSGCVRIDTELSFPAPGRLQLHQSIESVTGSPLPWQGQLAAALRGTSWQPQGGIGPGGRQRFRTPTLATAEALALLQQSFGTAVASAGLSLPPPQLAIEEANWLLGVRQRLVLELDLRQLPELPGLELHLGLTPLRGRAVRRAEPLAPSTSGAAAGGLRWPLQVGAVNHLEAVSWRWSPLGLGGLAVLLLLLLVSVLLRLRREAGFGPPELPA